MTHPANFSGLRPAFVFRLTKDDPAFTELCLGVFRHQARHNEIYATYLYHLGVDPEKIRQISDIPFLPIGFFKNHRIVSDAAPAGASLSAEIVFTSSGTTGTQQSRHEVIDLRIYRESFRRAFQQFYGDPKDVALLALLPAYLERKGSSLIYMVDDLIAQSKYEESGYFLYDYDQLSEQLVKLKMNRTPTLLLGVTYALLDYAEYLDSGDLRKMTEVDSALADFPELIVMETGGMKGRRKELIREELHAILQRSFHRESIHSEYGMTELLSQAYSSGQGLFECPPWMKILLRDTNDPFSQVRPGQTGGINVIDLANLHSCSFIATQDLGRMHPDGRFEVLGRFDNSDIRGCNLLIS